LKCPKCGHKGYDTPATCPECGFSGPVAQVEELAHISFLLDEIAHWPELSGVQRDRLQARYQRRLCELEVALGLREPPLSLEDTRHALQERTRLQQLLQLLDFWRERAWLHPAAADDLVVHTRVRIEELDARLARPDTPKIRVFEYPAGRVALLRSLRDEIETLHRQEAWADESAYHAAVADLEARVVQLETSLGLRRPERKPRPRPAVQRPVSAAPSRPREPLTWEMFWRTLLSERTLRTLLFVGVFLLFASAVTLVVYNWERFSPWVQVAFLCGFTLFFYGLGWYVRTRMRLVNSGLALTATGSLLVPVDFYAVYLSGGIFPRASWAEVWLLASAVCLIAYIITALLLRAEFFGYLIGLAAGNLLCAVLQLMGVSTDWWGPALGGLALVAIWPKAEESSSLRHVLVWPLNHLALLTVTVIISLASGFHIAGGSASGSSRLALALDWWIACAVYVLGTGRYLRRMLTSAACISAPVALYLTLALVFEAHNIHSAWQALGWALLTPVYLSLGWWLRRHGEPSETSRALCGWAVALMVWTIGWSLQDMSAAAASHAVLTGSVALAVALWERPGLLPYASLLSLSTAITWMSTLGLNLADYSLGLALVSILHFIISVIMRRAVRYTPYLYGAGFVVAALALLPPLAALDRARLAYALFNWIGLAGWGAYLAHTGNAGMHRLLRWDGPFSHSILHWAIALPLPLWLWLTWLDVRTADAWLGIGYAGLAWVMAGAGRWLARQDRGTSDAPLPWYVVAVLCSMAGPSIAGWYGEKLLLALTMLSSAALYFSYAVFFRCRWWLVPGGLVLPGGYLLALEHLGLPPDPLATSLALVPAAYLLIPIWLVEQREGYIGCSPFLMPLRATAHLVAVVAFGWSLGRGWAGTDAARMWAAAGQMTLGVAYGLLGWYTSHEAWGHIAAWLGLCAGGLIAVAYSRGQGSSAARTALLAVLYVGAERTLHALRARKTAARAWSIYHRPLLVAGWAVSGIAVALALLRNLWLLGGGPVRETWAIVALLLIVVLYATSARLFHCPLFLWLAASLLIAPWTILTHRGWYLWPEAPAAPRYALAWAVLAWLLALAGLLLDYLATEKEERHARLSASAYSFPLRVIAHILLPFSLSWGMADPSTSSVTWGLGLGFYILAAAGDRRHGRTGPAGARFLYPAALVGPVWAIYLLANSWPDLPHAHFGLLLLALALPVFLIARLLRRVDPADALPVYFSSYGCALVGTMLVSYERGLLVLALLFDAGLAALSAWRLREPLWVYPAAVCPPGALLLVLAAAGFEPHRRGWWLIGLGAVYLVQAWMLRRIRRASYAMPLMATAYLIVALGLPMCSYEQTAAFWAYSGATLIYAASATGLRQPLLLTPTVALLTVPYAIAVNRAWWLTPADRGLAWWPGILVVLLIAHLLDRFLGMPRDFPWGHPIRWLPEAVHRWTGWWGLPFYLWGYVGALASASLSSAHPERLALALALTALVYGQATYRFRLRGWLLLAVGMAQAAWLAAIGAAAKPGCGLPPLWAERLGRPAWQALAFLPVTLATAAGGLWIERRRGEGSPLAGIRALWTGWSRPLYALLTLDFIAGQVASLKDVHPGTGVSLVHTMLLFTLAVLWEQPWLPYVAAALGFITVIERLVWVMAPATDVPPALALLALGYGLVGYGLEYARAHGRLQGPLRVLERPLEQTGLLLSAIAIGMLSLWTPSLLERLLYALIGLPILMPENVPIVQAVVTVLALTGLLYLGAALVRRWYWRGYGAVALLLCAWSLELLLVWDLREVQWYALPAGMYLLGVGYLEWRQGRKGLARWIDRVALLLLYGTSFYQSLARAYGWPYALLLGAEGLLLIWWGSARRQRHLLAFGVLGVVLAVSGQLLRQLFSITNAWIVFGIVGLFVITIAILVERSLERIKRIAQDWRERLEKWDTSL